MTCAKALPLPFVYRFASFDLLAIAVVLVSILKKKTDVLCALFAMRGFQWKLCGAGVLLGAFLVYSLPFMMHNLDVESPGMLHLPSFLFMLSLLIGRPLLTLLWPELQKYSSLALNFPCV
jgi:hypothetical protein